MGSPSSLLQVDRDRAEADPRGGKRVLDAVQSLDADGHQALLFAVLGHKADLGVMALGPDLARLQAFQRELSTAPLTLVDSYVSLTELSEYTSSEDDERARLESEEGLSGAAQEASLADVARAHGALPRAAPAPGAAAEARDLLLSDVEAARRGRQLVLAALRRRGSELMAGHARVGRTYAGRVLQLITGSTGLDDWEWGVTLLADDPVALKEIVYEMRFDPVSAEYAEFGPFVTGLLSEPADALQRVGL